MVVAMADFSTDIAIFIRSLYGGGAERVMVSLANNFVDQDYKVDLLLPRATGPYLEQVSHRVNVVDLKSPNLLMSPPKLVNYLKQQRPSALLAALHYPCEIALWAKRLAGVPTRVVVSERNTLSVEAKNSKQLSVRLTPLAARLFYPWADQIVAISQGVADDLSKTVSVPSNKIQVIYNPALSPRIYDQSRQEVEHPWFQPKQLPVVLSVGRLHPQKDFPTLLKAFHQVQKHISARLVILGTGPEESALKKLISALQLTAVVDMPGFVQNPFAYMSRADVFVLSSAWEGFGNVLVEAMATGTPVVSTNCPSGPAEILADGKYGFLTPVGDETAMAKAILKVLSGEGKVVDPKWLQQFTPAVCTQKYLEALGMI